MGEFDNIQPKGLYEPQPTKKRPITLDTAGTNHKNPEINLELRHQLTRLKIWLTDIAVSAVKKVLPAVIPFWVWPVLIIAILVMVYFLLG